MRARAMHRSAGGGFGLVALMVGLAISMVTVLAMLALYRNTVQTTTGAREDTRMDAERLAALMAFHLDVQGAGYGLSSPVYGTHLVVLNNATLSGGSLGGTAVSAGTAGTAMVWSQADDNGLNIQCRGLLGAAGQVLRLGPVSCTAATQWNSLNWTSRQVVRRTVLQGAANLATSIVATSSAACQPFGITGGGALRVAVTATNSHTQATTLTTCLANFY